jgi:hypothetical protein
VLHGQGSEVFFLNAADLSELPFERQRLRAPRSAQVPHFNVNDVRDLALEIFGSVGSVDAGRLTPRTNVVTRPKKEQLKRSEEKQRRKDGGRILPRARTAAAEAERQAALSNRKADEVVRDAES